MVRADPVVQRHRHHGRERSVPCCASAASRGAHAGAGLRFIAIGGGLVAALGGGQVSAALLAGAVAVAAAFARLAFDAIVQATRLTPTAVGRLAQFETKFQMAWVLAAFIPVLIPIPRAVGFLIVTVLAAVAFVSYVGLAAHPRGSRPLRRSGRGSVPRSRSDAGR